MFLCATGDSGDDDLTDDELRALLVGHYRQCVEAGVPIMAVSTGGEQGRYREQILDAFPDIAFGDRLTLEDLPEVGPYVHPRGRRRLAHIYRTEMDGEMWVCQ